MRGVQQPPLDLMIPVSFGELVDKITILQLKVQNVDGPALEHVSGELALLQAIDQSCGADPADPNRRRLAVINRSLWDVEDQLRDCEAQRAFGRRFLALARSVYRLNDQRARATKRQLSLSHGSRVIEEKAYGSRR